MLQLAERWAHFVALEPAAETRCEQLANRLIVEIWA